MIYNDFYTNVTKYGSSIKYRGYDAEGHKLYESVKYRPILYTEAHDNDRDSGWVSLHDSRPLKAHRFDSMYECNEWRKQHKDIPGFNIHGNDRYPIAFIQHKFPGEIKYDAPMIDVCYIDIETEISETQGFIQPTDATMPITTIALKSSKCDTYIAWGMKAYDHSISEAKHLKIEYRQFDSETAMLLDFLDWWSDRANTPDVITGWNTEFYDIPYMVNRIVRVLGLAASKKLSPWGLINEKKVSNQWGADQVSYDIVGIEHLDYMTVFKKFTGATYGAQESYKLDFIAELVLGEKKLDYSHLGTMKEMYDNHFNTFLAYNYVDVELVVRINEKLALMDLIYAMSYFAGSNYQSTLGTDAIWDAIIFRQLAKDKIAIPPSTSSQSEAFEGAYVKEPVPGRYNWVVSFDLASLYPNIITQYNMSPETLLPDDCRPCNNVKALITREMTTAPEPDRISWGANGSAFAKDKQGFLPKLMVELYDKRKLTKNKSQDLFKSAQSIPEGSNERRLLLKEAEMLQTHQLALKILLNSVYGALGMKYFRYFDLRIAEAITLTGQATIRLAANATNEYLHDIFNDKKDRVITVDTDSLYVNMEDFVTKFKPENPLDFLDAISSNKIESVLEDAMSDLYNTLNAYTPRMVFDRENIADRGVFCVHPDTEIIIDRAETTIADFWDSSDDKVIACKGHEMKMLGEVKMTKSENGPDRVVFVSRKWHDGDMMLIDGLHVTPEHLIKLTNGEWKAAGDLTEHDNIVKASKP